MKSETRKKAEIRSPKNKDRACLRISAFFRISDFGFRISAFGFPFPCGTRNAFFPFGAFHLDSTGGGAVKQCAINQS